MLKYKNNKKLASFTFLLGANINVIAYMIISMWLLMAFGVPGVGGKSYECWCCCRSFMLVIMVREEQ